MEVLKNSRQIQTGVIIFSFTNISMATMVPGWVPVTRQVGLEWWPRLIELYGIMDPEKALGNQVKQIYSIKQESGETVY